MNLTPFQMFLVAAGVWYFVLRKPTPAVAPPATPTVAPSPSQPSVTAGTMGAEQQYNLALEKEKTARSGQDASTIQAGIKAGVDLLKGLFG